MREIKFRVWEVSKKQFIYEWDASYKRLAISFTGEVYHGGYDDVLANKEYIVQQYTGVKDKNGKEVYEGDIVRWGMSHDLKNAFPRLRFVEFCERQLIYKVVEVGDLPSSLDYLYEAKQPSTRWCEVIGNIYENPELLEVK